MWTLEASCASATTPASTGYRNPSQSHHSSKVKSLILKSLPKLQSHHLFDAFTRPSTTLYTRPTPPFHNKRPSFLNLCVWDTCAPEQWTGNAFPPRSCPRAIEILSFSNPPLSWSHWSHPSAVLIYVRCYILTLHHTPTSHIVNAHNAIIFTTLCQQGFLRKPCTKRNFQH